MGRGEGNLMNQQASQNRNYSQTLKKHGGNAIAALSQDGAGYLSSLSVGDRSIDIQTEILPRPVDHIMITVYYSGRVLLSHKVNYHSDVTDPRELAGKCHKEMEEKVRSRLAKHKDKGSKEGQAPANLPWAINETELADLHIVNTIEGILGACIVDINSGMALMKRELESIELEEFARGGAEMVREKVKVIRTLGLKDKIEDILMTLGGQYHLIRMIGNTGKLMLYIVLNREDGNLAMARHQLKVFEKAISESPKQSS